MENVLIVSNTSGTMGLIGSLFKSVEVDNVVTSSIGLDARNCIAEQEFDLVIIDSPLADEFGEEFAVDAAEATAAGIILLVDEKLLEETSRQVEDYGVFALPKPLNADEFLKAVKLITANRRRILRLQNENLKLHKKIEEMKLVDRAKLILIQVLKMTEDQAQHYIEKQSMDLRQSRIATAENILRTYEN